ncbi:hypothetical protein DY000_02049472 [Brassica cretica]|uniref:Uncharacterized protein n=1 Tax=Brassica cretica TaxID=69181 RepID=A0ABQ7EVS4_BRACR|nr:hypothetical protein DY000_02049472 [Brassica cretica]
MRDNFLDSELSALRNSEALFSTCYVSMTGTRLPDEHAQAVRSLGSLSNYVRLDPRRGSGSALRNTQDETIRRSDIEALIKLLKDNSGGGSRNVEQSTEAQPEENSVAHDQDEMPSESDAETQVEAPSEENEAEPEQIQPLRRKTTATTPALWLKLHSSTKEQSPQDARLILQIYSTLLLKTSQINNFLVIMNKYPLPLCSFDGRHPEKLTMLLQNFLSEKTSSSYANPVTTTSFGSIYPSINHLRTVTCAPVSDLFIVSWSITE